jgi:hypothetical protein
MFEEDIEKVWPGLILHLCSRHRIDARNGRPTDYKIEDLRKEHYSGYTESKYFRKLIYELASLLSTYLFLDIIWYLRICCLVGHSLHHTKSRKFTLG